MLFRPFAFGLLFPNTLNYLVFQYFDIVRIWWRLFQKRVMRTIFDNYGFIIFCWIVWYIDNNMRTLSENITFICTSFRNRPKSEHLSRISVLFPNECKWIIYFPMMYVYCIYTAVSKSLKQLQHFLKKRSETSVVLIIVW